VAQYHHRLLSLEIDLKDGVRSGAMNEADFSRRVKKLKDALRQLTALQQANQQTTEGTASRADIGLPLLDRCTPPERDVCAAFLDERDLLLLGMKRETGKVLHWLRLAISGRANPIAMILRLSKLRKYIQTHEAALGRGMEEARQQNLQIERWLGQIKGGKERDASRATLDTLVDVFDELDGTTSRVAKLRAAVKREEARNRSMIAWLRQEELKSRAVPTPQPPPSPLDTIRVVAARQVGSGSTKQQRQLVERFWRDVIQAESPAPRPEDTHVARAQKMISKDARRAPWALGMTEIQEPAVGLDDAPAPSRKTRGNRGKHA
jgi:hypothetical protein